jgi:hydrogenase/urease accessory protein HupE
MNRLLLVLVLSLTGAFPLRAHDSRPVYVEITETGPAAYSVRMRAPASLMAANVPEVTLPEACSPEGEGIDAGGGMTSFLRVRQYACPEPLAGQAVAIRYPILNPSLTTLFHMRTTEGATMTKTTKMTKLMGPQESEWVVPAEPTPLGIAREYAMLGIRHILEGLDHLLFVLGLLFLVRDRWTLLKTITAFTVAHSITLGIATLGYARAPMEPLNAVIALSILFLGPEIVRYHRGQSSLTIRHPWIVAFVFGLLHGFGFASGLTAIGLPTGEIPLALLLFNAGVEIGQVGFVLLVILLERSFRLLEFRWPQWAAVSPGYVIGALGAYWTIQRLLILNQTF